MEFGFEFSQEQKARHLPRLIEANYLLHLSTQELQTVIATELAENPALEVNEEMICPHCGAALEGGFCSTCRSVDIVDTPTLQSDDGDWSEIAGKSSPLDDEFDPVARITGAVDQREELTADLRAVLPFQNDALALTLVESLDRQGFI